MPVRGAPLVSVEADWLQAVTLRPLGIEISVTSTKDCQPPLPRCFVLFSAK